MVVAMNKNVDGDHVPWGISARWLPQDVRAFLGEIYALPHETVEQGYSRATSAGWLIVPVVVKAEIN
jgi:hypothetical protein